MSDSEFTRFVFAVGLMRDLQKRYFFTQDKETQAATVEQEKLVDNWVRNLKREFTKAPITSNIVVSEK